MTKRPPLSGLKVLVTRPQDQAKKLIDTLKQAGAKTVVFPLIDIVAIEPQQWPQVDLAGQDMVIFISRNAVSYFCRTFDDELPANVAFVAVGDATADSMRRHQLPIDIVAPSPAGSESLLAMPAMQSMLNKRVLIVRGEGGRELLANTLALRGATISYLEVYKRSLPAVNEEQLTQAETVDCIIITSVASLDNLCQLMAKQTIKNKTLVVISDRIRQHALKLGFQHVYVSDDVNDAAITQQLIQVGQTNGKKC